MISEDEMSMLRGKD